MDKCGENEENALFYIRKTIANSWSRTTLLNWLDSDLYGHQGKAIIIFSQSLATHKDIWPKTTNDPYNFNFLTIRRQYDDLDEQYPKISTGTWNGFSFICREFQLVVGKTEQFIDLLLYNFKIHCFVVVEVKVSDFDPKDMGQLLTYVSAVDGIMKREGDLPTIGLLICKTKDNILAQYSTNAVKVPIGISEYRITNFIQSEFKGTLPTIEELEQELNRK